MSSAECENSIKAIGGFIEHYMISVLSLERFNIGIVCMALDFISRHSSKFGFSRIISKIIFYLYNTGLSALERCPDTNMLRFKKGKSTVFEVFREIIKRKLINREQASYLKDFMIRKNPSDKISLYEWKINVPLVTILSVLVEMDLIDVSYDEAYLFKSMMMSILKNYKITGMYFVDNVLSYSNGIIGDLLLLFDKLFQKGLISIDQEEVYLLEGYLFSDHIHNCYEQIAFITTLMNAGKITMNADKEKFLKTRLFSKNYRVYCKFINSFIQKKLIKINVDEINSLKVEILELLRSLVASTKLETCNPKEIEYIVYGMNLLFYFLENRSLEINEEEISFLKNCAEKIELFPAQKDLCESINNLIVYIDLIASIDREMDTYGSFIYFEQS